MLSFYLFTVVFSANVFAGDSINIPQKVYRLFHNAFPEVKNESWYKSPDTYEAYFKNVDSSSCKIYYSRDGKLLSTLKYYFGNALPLFIRIKVAEKYAGRNIFGVIEIYANNKTIYCIMLEDNRKWYKVKSDINGNITLDETLIKAS